MQFCAEYTLANEAEKKRLDGIVDRCTARIQESGEITDAYFNALVTLFVFVHCYNVF
jgi:hypothetical protein